MTDIVQLNPGDFWFGGGATQVRTILGSCVAIVLWHPQQCIGGMCHILLPDQEVRHDGGAQRPARYAGEAVGLFSAEVQRHATSPAQYEVRLFGGGRMWRIERQRDIGEHNVRAARQLLADAGFRISHEHVGGDGHRQLQFNVSTGKVVMRHVPIGKPPGQSA